MATEKRPTMLRLPEELYEKVRYLAFLERRSVNMQIEHALSTYICDYESRHGPIQLPTAPNGNQKF
ncbi:Arc family DNA-binding protein [Oscillospiraceae bacterium 50-16]|nr:Arc family DNA-binding protein [Lawsonibacter sp.]